MDSASSSTTTESTISTVEIFKSSKSGVWFVFEHDLSSPFLFPIGPYDDFTFKAVIDFARQQNIDTINYPLKLLWIFSYSEMKLMQSLNDDHFLDNGNVYLKNGNLEFKGIMEKANNWCCNPLIICKRIIPARIIMNYKWREITVLVKCLKIETRENVFKSQRPDKGVFELELKLSFSNWFSIRDKAIQNCHLKDPRKRLPSDMRLIIDDGVTLTEPHQLTTFLLEQAEQHPNDKMFTVPVVVSFQDHVTGVYASSKAVHLKRLKRLVSGSINIDDLKYKNQRFIFDNNDMRDYEQIFTKVKTDDHFKYQLDSSSMVVTNEPEFNKIVNMMLLGIVSVFSDVDWLRDPKIVLSRSLHAKFFGSVFGGFMASTVKFHVHVGRFNVGPTFEWKDLVIVGRTKPEKVDVIDGLYPLVSTMLTLKETQESRYVIGFICNLSRWMLVICDDDRFYFHEEESDFVHDANALKELMIKIFYLICKVSCVPAKNLAFSSKRLDEFTNELGEVVKKLKAND